MKQIILILLFIFTVQIKIHTESPKEENTNRRPVHSPSILKGKCSPGYVLDCRVIGMYKGNHNPPKRCFCIKDKTKEKKVSKIPKKSFNKINGKIKSKTFTSFSSSDDIMCPKGYKFMCGYLESIGDYRCFCRKIYSGKN